MIDQALCDELHQQLLHDRERISHEIATLASTGIGGDVFLEDESDASDQHPADEGSELFEREKNLGIQRSLRVSLQEIDDSLHRFQVGKYGLCEECGRPIPENRLKALPQATHCIECQTKLERQQRF